MSTSTVLFDKETFKQELFHYLYSNLDRAIYELYTLCEYDANDVHCNGVLEALKVALRDFDELRERIQLIVRASNTGRQHADTVSPARPFSPGPSTKDSGESAESAFHARHPSGSLATQKRGGIAWEVRTQSRLCTHQSTMAQAMIRSMLQRMEMDRDQQSDDGEVADHALPEYTRTSPSFAESGVSTPDEHIGISTSTSPHSNALVDALPLEEGDKPLPAMLHFGAGNAAAKHSAWLSSSPAKSAAVPKAILSTPPRASRSPEMAKIRPSASPASSQRALKSPPKASPRQPDAVAAIQPKPDTLLLFWSKLNEEGVLWGDVLMDQPVKSPAPAPAVTERPEVATDATMRAPPVNPWQTKKLHVKLSSPDRNKMSPAEAALRAERRHAQAEANKEKLEEERKKRLDEHTSRTRDVSDRQAAKVKEQEHQLQLKHDAARARHEEQILARRSKADTVSQKVNEVAFIKSVTTENKRLEIEQKIMEADRRKYGHIAKIRAKTEEHSKRVVENVQSRRLAEAAEVDARRAAINRRLEESSARRDEVLKSRASPSYSARPRVSSLSYASALGGSTASLTGKFYDVADRTASATLPSSAPRRTLDPVPPMPTSAPQKVVAAPVTIAFGCVKEQVVEQTVLPAQPIVDPVVIHVVPAEPREPDAAPSEKAPTGGVATVGGAGTIMQPAATEHVVATPSTAESAASDKNRKKRVRKYKSAVEESAAALRKLAIAQRTVGAKMDDTATPLLARSVGIVSRECTPTPSKAARTALSDCVNAILRKPDPPRRKAGQMPTPSASVLRDPFQFACAFADMISSHPAAQSSVFKLRDSSAVTESLLTDFSKFFHFLGGDGLLPQLRPLFHLLPPPAVSASKATLEFLAQETAPACCSLLSKDFIKAYPVTTSYATVLLAIAGLSDGGYIDILSNTAGVAACDAILAASESILSTLDKAKGGSVNISVPPLSSMLIGEVYDWSDCNVACSVLLSGLQLLWVILRRSPESFGELTANATECVQKTIAYLVASSALKAIVNLVEAVRRSADTVQMNLGDLLRPLLSCLAALLVWVSKLSADFPASREHCAQVIDLLSNVCTFDCPALALSIVNSAAAHSNKSAGTAEAAANEKTRSALLDPDSCTVLTACFHLMNLYAQVDRVRFQDALGSTESHLTVRHAIDCCLHLTSPSLTVDDASQQILLDGLLAEILIFISSFSTCHVKHQESLHWGKQPSTLQRLCNLPFHYFSDPYGRRLLFPALISATFQSPTNIAVVAKEVSPQLLKQFVAHCCAPENSDSEDTAELARRFPREHWEPYVAFMDSLKPESIK